MRRGSWADDEKVTLTLEIPGRPDVESRLLASLP
jgi:hypothetical protein